MVEQLQTQNAALAIALIIAVLVALVVAPLAIRIRRDSSARDRDALEIARLDRTRLINALADEQEFSRRYREELQAAQRQMRELIDILRAQQTNGGNDG